MEAAACCLPRACQKLCKGALSTGGMGAWQQCLRGAKHWWMGSTMGPATKVAADPWGDMALATNIYYILKLSCLPSQTSWLAKNPRPKTSSPWRLVHLLPSLTPPPCSIYRRPETTTVGRSLCPRGRAVGLQAAGHGRPIALDGVCPHRISPHDHRVFGRVGGPR